jgi:sodium/potassium-transporting ATPase subunit alpha
MSCLSKARLTFYCQDVITSIVLPSGEVVPMTPDLIAQVTDLHSRWASSGQRVLLARRVLSEAKLDTRFFQSPDAADCILKEYTAELVAVGLIDIRDPPHAEIPEVVKICRGGGIRFYMVALL